MKNHFIKNCFVFLFLIVTITCNNVFGQLSTNETPISFKYPEIEWKTSEYVIMPSLDMSKIKQEDARDEEEGVPPRFGYPHSVNLNLNNSGEWVTLPNGDKIWRLQITCPKAKSINLLYDTYWLPQGAKLFVYNKTKERYIGAFTSDNNKGSRENLRGFATGLIYDDSIIVEYYEPQKVLGEGILSISYIVQGYRFILAPETIESGLGTSGNCQVNINCVEGNNWKKEKNAVAMILVNGHRYCTGSLINTTANNHAPLLLTADHCLGGWANNDVSHDAISDPNLDFYSFWWNYESPDCTNPIYEPTYYVTTGAVVVANKDYSTGSDFALLYLSEDPQNNPHITPYYLGWDNSGNSGSSVVGIHHPCGDVKKIATKNSAPMTSGNYWNLYWDQTTNGYSVTEGGSSGSPLINNDRHIIGQLWGGSSVNCSNPSQDNAKYGKFNISWTGGGAIDNRRKLQPWLDPLNTGLSICNGIGIFYDMYTRDNTYDTGGFFNPNTFVHDSPDIWLRRSADGGIDHQLAMNGTNYVYVTVYNRGPIVSRVSDSIRVYFRRAALENSNNWSSNTWYYGGVSALPIIPVGGNATVKIPVNISTYQQYDNFAFYTRIDSEHDTLRVQETSSTSNNIDFNNNISAKNTQITSILISDANYGLDANFAVTSGPSSVIGSKLRLDLNDGTTNILDSAEVTLVFPEDLMTDWTPASENIKQLTANTFLVTGETVEISDVPETDVTLRYNFLTRRNTFNEIFKNHITQYVGDDEELVGSLTIQVEKPVRAATNLFTANAGNDTAVLLNTTATLHATQINENATYRWYNKNRNFLYEGVNFSVIPLQTSEYILEVTAKSDGFRDLDTVKVTVVPGCIRSITPNPVGSNWVTVSYEYATTVTSAHLYIYNTGTTTLVGSYDLSNLGNVSSLDVEVTNYPTGSYTAVLVCDNAVCHSKVLIRQ